MVVVVMISGGATTREKLLEAVVWTLSVTVTVKVNVPEPVGDPEMAPALVKLNPAGSAPALTANEYGVKPPEAVTVWE